MKIYQMVAIVGVTLAAGQAEANCSDRIDAAHAHPSIVSDTAVKDDGKITKYQDGGPATPRENWFGSKPELSAVLAKLRIERSGNVIKMAVLSDECELVSVCRRVG